MERPSSLLLVLLLGFAQLITSFEAVSLSGTHGAEEEFQSLPEPGSLNQGAAAEENWEELLLEGRMAFENNDYPGPGANNHHTPRQPRIN